MFLFWNLLRKAGVPSSNLGRLIFNIAKQYCFDSNILILCCKFKYFNFLFEIEVPKNSKNCCGLDGLIIIQKKLLIFNQVTFKNQNNLLFLRAPIVQRPSIRPFQGRDPGSNPGGGIYISQKVLIKSKV